MELAIRTDQLTKRNPEARVSNRYLCTHRVGASMVFSAPMMPARPPRSDCCWAGFDHSTAVSNCWASRWTLAPACWPESVRWWNHLRYIRT
jgi:hypothetical protein